jgi:Abortive infection alpha
LGDNLIPISDEQAKLGQELLKAGRDAGGYLADILDDLPKDLLGLLIGDKVKAWRAERLAKLWIEAKKRLAEKGIEEPAPANPKMVLPILAAAADENSDELQDLWARLLAAAMNPDQSKRGRLGFIDALKRLDPQDANVLIWLRGKGGGPFVPTRNKIVEELGGSRDEVNVSLTNLVNTEFAVRSGPDAGMLELTPFGREFLRVVLE